MATSTLSSEGQVTIPKEIRERLGLQQGDKVEFVTEGGVTYLRPARGGDNPFEAYVGALDAFDDAEAVNTWVREMRDEE